MDADDYLTLPPAYAEAIDGLRWSAGCDAVEFAGGHTLAVVEHLAVLLEGVFAAHPAIPHFAHVLHLLKLTTRGGARDPDGPLARLHEAFLAAAGPGTSRNLGALFAHLCRDLPHVAAPPKPAAVQLDLKRRVLFPEPPADPLRGCPGRAEKPPLGPDEFERRLAAVAAESDVPTLAHWIRHGGPPAGRAGKALAAAVKEPPRRVESLTTVLRRRPRLAGAVALAPTLDAALALPPRRRRPDAVPQGGYAGVVTRGDPERLLPSQFAMDPLDFVRRFAEHELLYFRREEPHRGDRPERVVVFDQGVRTWGGVRVALAAAVVALAGKDRKKAGPLRLAVTSADRPPFDPADVPPSELADLLEASDLTPHPAAGLAAALRADARDRPRDVILLTHPRSLAEPAVRAAAAGRRPTDRLFALTVAEDGRAELGEWRPGGVVRVRSFRVDLTDRPADRPPAEPAAPPVAVGAWRPWTGDVEPITYPFRPGLLGAPLGLAFDLAGEHALVLSAGGLLHLAKLDGSAPEVLPRAMVNGMPLVAVETVLGVDGGFAVCGKFGGSPGAFHFDSTEVGGQSLTTTSVAVHYELMRRRVTVHRLGMAGSRVGRWFSFPDLNAVAVVNAAGHIGVDLATGIRFPADERDTGAVTRAREAQGRSKALHRPPPGISLVETGLPPATVRGPWVKAAGGVVWLGGIQPPWPPFIPKSDGRRLFMGVTVSDRCQLAGRTLAMDVRTVDSRPRLYLFQGPTGRLLAEYLRGTSEYVFQLSPDGRRLARQMPLTAVAVTEVADGRQVARLEHARIHGNLGAHRDGGWLKLTVGKMAYAFSLEAGPLMYRQEELPAVPPPVDAGASEPVPRVAAYDGRFQPAAAGCGLGLVLDTVGGQLIVLGRDGNPAAHILVRRGLAAIVLPDGTRWGSPALLGGSETPGAAEKVGRALQQAAGG